MRWDSHGEERGDVEKLMYLAWLGEKSTRSEVSEVMLGRVGEELLALDELPAPAEGVVAALGRSPLFTNPTTP